MQKTIFDVLGLACLEYKPFWARKYTDDLVYFVVVRPACSLLQSPSSVLSGSDNYLFFFHHETSRMSYSSLQTITTWPLSRKLFLMLTERALNIISSFFQTRGHWYRGFEWLWQSAVFRCLKVWCRAICVSCETAISFFPDELHKSSSTRRPDKLTLKLSE